MLRKLAICLFLLAGGVAWAGPSEADIEAAKVHYQSGAQYYEGGAYDDAIREFNEAYRLSKAPALLYNLSQAYEKKGDYISARDNLKRYIDSGNAEEGELPQLQEKLRAYDQRLRAKPEPKPTVPKTAPPQPRPVPAPVATPEAMTPPPPEPSDSGPPFKVWKWVAGGAGVASVILATVFAVDAKSQQNKIEDAQGRGQIYSQELQDAYSRGQRDSTLAVVFGVAGTAFLATSVVMFVVDAGKTGDGGERPGARLLPIVSPDGAGAAVIYHF